MASLAGTLRHRWPSQHTRLTYLAPLPARGPGTAPRYLALFVSTSTIWETETCADPVCLTIVRLTLSVPCYDAIRAVRVRQPRCMSSHVSLVMLSFQITSP
ncbi:hypothetical protein BD311DRAFT_378612 [Dichomitus squalens]|uniref:Uncharacterized protein n=1 Tax=Dichomitus squalens TaxID=114155 RepID=A0A4Q9MNC5_9APHY|nr:hypothetical protein BD311DRAFT_378612 [Dichomitus squalens]